MRNKKINAVVWKEDKLFVAKALGFELASQGFTKKQAIKNLEEALELLFEGENEVVYPVSLPENPEITTLYA